MTTRSSLQLQVFCHTATVPRTCGQGTMHCCSCFLVALNSSSAAGFNVWQICWMQVFQLGKKSRRGCICQSAAIGRALALAMLLGPCLLRMRGVAMSPFCAGASNDPHMHLAQPMSRCPPPPCASASGTLSLHMWSLSCLISRTQA